MAFLLFIVLCVVSSGWGGEAPQLTRLTEPVEHGEGPHWDPATNALYYVDISGQAVHRYDPETQKDIALKFDRTVALVVPMRSQMNKFAVALGLDLAVLTWDWVTGYNSTSVVVRGVDRDKPLGNRFNDGKADARGRLWAGTMGYEDPVSGVAAGLGTLYRLDNRPSEPCRADPVVSPVTISNGIAWTADNRVMYYIDSPTRQVVAYDYDLDNGNVSNPRVVFKFESTKGVPDGMTIDVDGNLWIACWGGSQVIQVDPSTGRLLRQIKLPVERVTSVAFGGEKLDTLYVTSMRTGLTPEQLESQPLAGALWRVTGLGARGLPPRQAFVNCKCQRD